MADFDDADPTGEDEFEDQDEEMEDANEPDHDAEQEQDQDQDDDQGDEDDEDDDGDNDDNDDDEEEDGEDKDQQDSPSQPATIAVPRRTPTRDGQTENPSVILTSPSPRQQAAGASGIVASWIPPVRKEALTAQAYDIVPTMAAPQSTSINAVTATLDMRWVFSGGTDGYVRMYNWVETANGKVPLTVAQKHPFVDSVMKAGSLTTYWENEERSAPRTPSKNDEDGKWTSPVYSLACHREALWLLSGTEGGGINLQTCRHSAGHIITTLKEHTSAVSVLNLAQDETTVLSGSWDKNIHDWDLNTGKVKRSFRGSGGQISAVETRPMSHIPVPEVSETAPDFSDTFFGNNSARPRANGSLTNGFDARRASGTDQDAVGSPDGSLFGENDHGSLFGEDNAGVGGSNAFGDDDELTQALANGLQDDTQDAPGEEDAAMGGMGTGGPVQPPNGINENSGAPAGVETIPEFEIDGDAVPPTIDGTSDTANGLPHATDEPLTAPPTNETPSLSASDLPAQSESTFLSAAIDGSLRIWDKRLASPVASLTPHGSTPPWCTGACWSPDGNSFYVGRRNNMVEEFSIHKMGSSRNEPSRQFKFQAGSGAVYAVRPMPNGRHLICASQDILRIYDLQHSAAGGEPSTTSRKNASATPFTIVPGHRGGVISSVFIDPTCRFMLSAAGNRGWEGASTEVLLGYEIGALDEEGQWHR
ncbi:transcription factor (SPT8) [Teratosphaeria destructans]|uniref:Transcription factor (SPT8) n=1 Tax=Teratosphaeria destructans TaxID=418781 RepID=A0A9W7SQ22_9PEZI|nr:transcription factor (SPT8) [Teratosphaeria destructans]